MDNRRVVGLVLVIIGLLGSSIFVPLLAIQSRSYMGWGPMSGMMGSGMMGGIMGNQRGPPTANMTVTKDQARTIAENYLKTYLPGASTEDPDVFYGYYTIHILKDGKIYGMLSVNGYNGQVWYHSWHGQLIQMKKL